MESLIENSKAMPITGALLMDKPKLLELVDQMRLGIPQEVKAAEEMLSQKDQIMNNALADARRARSKSEDEFREKLTQSEFQRRADQLVAEAEQKAARILQQADAEAQSRRTEADAYALRSLRALEQEVNSIGGSVRKGIDMLAGNALVGASMSNGNGYFDD